MHSHSAANHIPGVDVLRGLAALLVTLHHAHLRFVIQRHDVTNLAPTAVADVLFWSGYYAVVVFFVISGFLITSLSLRRWGSPGGIRIGEFYRLRAARLLPCLFLLLAVLSVLHLLQVSGFTIPAERASLSRALVAGLGFHVNWLEGHRGYLPANWDVLWSLSIEEAFYAMFPLACILLRRERMLFILLLALIVVGPFNRAALEGQSPWDEYHWLSGMDGIAFGCLAGWLVTRRPPAANRLTAFGIGGLSLISLNLVFRGATTQMGLKNLALDVTLLEVGTALLLVAIAKGWGTAQFATAGARLLRLAGRCSYEIYLTHMFVVMSGAALFRRVFPDGPPGRWAYPLTYLLIVGLSMLLGLLVHRYLSEPVNRWLRGRTQAAALVTSAPV